MCQATSELAEGPSSASAFCSPSLKGAVTSQSCLLGLLLLCLINIYLLPPLPPDFAEDDDTDDVVPDGKDTADMFEC